MLSLQLYLNISKELTSHDLQHLTLTLTSYYQKKVWQFFLLHLNHEIVKPNTPLHYILNFMQLLELINWLFHSYLLNFFSQIFLTLLSCYSFSLIATRVGSKFLEESEIFVLSRLTHQLLDRTKIIKNDFNEVRMDFDLDNICFRI